MNPGEENMRPYYERYFTVAAFGLIVLLTAIAYSDSFTASFHFDDGPSITDNPLIKSVTSDNIDSILHGVRPVVYLSIMLNYQLSGLNVVGWHIFNVGLHAANGMLVYLLISQLLTAASLRGRYSRHAGWMALFGALLFAVHPVQTESVTYIITRTEVVATFFYLGAILLFGAGARADKAGYYWAAVISAALAMGSKEWAVTLPAILFLYDYLFLSGENVKKIRSRWWVYLLIIASTWIVLRSLDLFSPGSSVGFNINASSSAASGPEARKAVTFWTYFRTSCNVIWTYVRLLFLPIHQNIDYDYPVATTHLAFPTLLSFQGHVAVIGGSFWLYWKTRWMLVPCGVAWFYITLSPVQSIVPVSDVIFEHRLYLPSIGFFLAFVVGYEALFMRLSGEEWKPEEKKPPAPAVVISKKQKRKAKKLAAG